MVDPEVEIALRRRSGVKSREVSGRGLDRWGRRLEVRTASKTSFLEPVEFSS
jgi:hypothetical protein